MSNGGGVIGWLEGVIVGLILMAVGGVVKLIRLDQRVSALEDREVECAKTHDEVIRLREQIGFVKNSQGRIEENIGKIFSSIDNLKDEVRGGRPKPGK